MKKLFSALLVLVSLLTLASCENSARIGQAFTTSGFEITIDEVSFGTNLDASSSANKLFADLGEDAPTTVAGYPKAYVAKADRAYAVVRYTVKLVAKDTQYFNNTMKIKYNNGYAFSQTPYSGEDLIVDFDTRYSSYKFEPLSSSMHFITIIDVPREVMTNTQASLYVEIYGKSCKVR